MTKTFRAQYEVADGYVGSSRPQNFNIGEGDFEDNDDESYLREFYQQSVQDHFEQNVYPEVSKEDEFVAWAKARIAEGNEQ